MLTFAAYIKADKHTVVLTLLIMCFLVFDTTLSKSYDAKSQFYYTPIHITSTCGEIQSFTGLLGLVIGQSLFGGGF